MEDKSTRENALAFLAGVENKVHNLLILLEEYEKIGDISTVRSISHWDSDRRPLLLKLKERINQILEDGRQFGYQKLINSIMNTYSKLYLSRDFEPKKKEEDRLIYQSSGFSFNDVEGLYNL